MSFGGSVSGAGGAGGSGGAPGASGGASGASGASGGGEASGGAAGSQSLTGATPPSAESNKPWSRSEVESRFNTEFPEVQLDEAKLSGLSQADFAREWTNHQRSKETRRAFLEAMTSPFEVAGDITLPPMSPDEIAGFKAFVASRQSQISPRDWLSLYRLKDAISAARGAKSASSADSVNSAVDRASAPPDGIQRDPGRTGQQGGQQSGQQAGQQVPNPTKNPDIDLFNSVMGNEKDVDLGFRQTPKKETVHDIFRRLYGEDMDPSKLKF